MGMSSQCRDSGLGAWGLGPGVAGLRPGALCKEEFVSPDVCFAESSLTRESCGDGLLLLLRGFLSAIAWLAAVWGSDLFAPAIACCHTAPIGNLGMRTQATRHFECTGNLHGVLHATLFNDNGDS